MKLLLFAVVLLVGCFAAGAGLWLATDDAGSGITATEASRATSPEYQLAVADSLGSRDEKWKPVRFYRPESLVGAGYVRTNEFGATVIQRWQDLRYVWKYLDKGTAVRLQYETDGHFERFRHHDKVFIINNLGMVEECIDADQFRPANSFGAEAGQLGR